jgi:hygromycin-B 4-O-kinase
VAQARAFVADRYGTPAGHSLTPAGAGEWSQAYAFTVDAGLLSATSTDEGVRSIGSAVPGSPSTSGTADLVIRFGRHREDFAKDRAMGELASSQAAGALPVPRVLEIGDTPWGFFVTAERCYGQYLDQLDGDEMRDTLPALLQTLDTIGALEPPGLGFGPWSPDGAAPFTSWRDALLAIGQEQPRTAGWRELLDGRPAAAQVFRRGLAGLDRITAGLVPPRRFVHGDLLNRNVLVQTGDGRGAVTAMLDWGNSQYGDPLYDLAWLLFWWPWYPQWSAIDIGDAIQAHLAESGPRPPDADRRLLAYQLHIGLDHLAYNAFTRRWESLDRVADQTDELLRRC